MKQLILAGILGGLAAFIWGAISWTVLPWHVATMDNLPEVEAFSAEFNEKIPEGGVYLSPGAPHGDEAEMQKIEQMHAAGPVGQLFILKEGVKMMDPVLMLRGFLLMVGASLFGAGLLTWSAPLLRRYGQRVLFVTLIGAAAVFSTRLIDWNYWYYPAGYTFVNAVDLLITWFIIGLVTAALVRPATAQAMRSV